MNIHRETKDTSDCITFQNDLVNLLDWCSINKLPLNINKCKVMSFSRKVNTVLCDYQLDNLLIPRIYNCKDLVVLFDSKLTFSEHIENTVHSEIKILGFVIGN